MLVRAAKSFVVLRPQNKMSGPTLKMKSKGGCGVLKYFGNDRKPLNRARICTLLCGGRGTFPIFQFFFPTRKVSNPRLHLTVSCRFRNSSGINISSLSSSNGCTPPASFYSAVVICIVVVVVCVLVFTVSSLVLSVCNFATSEIIQWYFVIIPISMLLNYCHFLHLISFFL